MNSYATNVQVAGKNVPVNEYMEGVCYSCGEWHAPIVFEDLLLLKNQPYYLGSTKPQKDKDVWYERLVWYEAFRCPKCNQEFAVPFTNL
jgi:hypothetical protein